MKKFLAKIALLLVAIFAMMTLLDVGYTGTYRTAKPRTKFQVLKSLTGTRLDYVFLGSSRVENGIVPQIIEERTGKKAYNFGYQAAKMDDIYTMLKLLKTYRIASEAVFIQIDYIFDVNGRSIVLPYEMAPFLHDNEQTRAYFSGESNYGLLAYLPFYRYCYYDQKIGFRELLLNMADKKIAGAASLGFSPLYGNNPNNVYALPATIGTHNRTLDDIRKFAAENEIKVEFFCAPFWRETKNLDYIEKLKGKIPDLTDYSSAIHNPALFANNSHLNEKGARAFTEIFVDDLLQTIQPTK